ncbi:MAG: TAXI family TRAP transporter solute-binding subunit [Sporichthyaceae bacterium]
MIPLVRRGSPAAVAALAVLGLAACGGNTAKQAAATSAPAQGDIACAASAGTRLGVATGNTTGVFYGVGNAFAQQVEALTGGQVKLTVAETGGSVQNIEQLVAGDYQVAFAFADNAADAVAGTGPFEGKPQPVRAVARVHNGYAQMVVRTAANISTLADLKGKRVSTGSPKSGTENVGRRILTAAGLNPDSDVATQRLDLTKTVDGMKDGTLDAMFFSGGLPTPAITDLLTAAGDKVAFLDVSSVLPKLQEISSAYKAGTIPEAIYGRPEIPTIVVPNLVLVREDADANLACVLTRAVLERAGDMAVVNAASKDIAVSLVGDTAPVPLHRGSEKALTLPVPTSTPVPSTTPSAEAGP